jgi:hypothetical protein
MNARTSSINPAHEIVINHRKQIATATRRQRLVALATAIATTVFLFHAVASISARHDAGSTVVQSQQTHVAQTSGETVRR